MSDLNRMTSGHGGEDLHKNRAKNSSTIKEFL